MAKESMPGTPRVTLVANHWARKMITKNASVNKPARGGGAQPTRKEQRGERRQQQPGDRNPVRHDDERHVPRT